MGRLTRIAAAGGPPAVDLLAVGLLAVGLLAVTTPVAAQISSDGPSATGRDVRAAADPLDGGSGGETSGSVGIGIRGAAPAGDPPWVDAGGEAGATALPGTTVAPDGGPAARSPAAATEPAPAPPEPAGTDAAPTPEDGAAPDDARSGSAPSPGPAGPPDPTQDVARDEPQADGLDELTGLMRELVRLMREVVFVPETEGRGNALHMIAFALLALVFGSLARRIRERLPASGFVPRTLGVLHVLLRLGAILLLLALVARLVPGPAIALLVLATAAALGWSARDVLPDVVAGLVLLLERRLRRGQWLSGAGFEGIIETVGLRATWLRDGSGNRVSIPNRQLLSTPTVSAAGVGAEHQVTVRIDSDLPASRIRRALRDAVLVSPWIPPGAAPTVLRDPDEPALWHVRSRLLEARFGTRFEGELHERAQEILEVGETG